MTWWQIYLIGAGVTVFFGVSQGAFRMGQPKRGKILDVLMVALWPLSCIGFAWAWWSS